MASTEQEDNNVENNNQEICDSEHEDPAETITSDNEEIVYSAEISVGDEYQADIPELQCGKNFDMISELIDIKRADCVGFYYLWKKTKSGSLSVKQHKKPKTTLGLNLQSLREILKQEKTKHPHLTVERFQIDILSWARAHFL
ncbi:hypothetical protein WA026_007621 [Henosepilachna vigintioctopunctata]|uniref:Uncharacterized protein n=1 Tax=Henosepilachna vigintioctopunctata TaxID=420089 RepID=A0AAW1TY98_9CUCU